MSLLNPFRRKSTLDKAIEQAFKDARHLPLVTWSTYRDVRRMEDMDEPQLAPTMEFVTYDQIRQAIELLQGELERRNST